MFWRLSVLGIAFLALQQDARAQAVPYSENFDAGALPAGWTTTQTDASLSGVRWRVDGLDSPVGPGPDGATFGGSPSSLNYNDDTDFDNAAANSGTATSPAISIAGTGGAIIVSFRCNYETETTGGTFDVRSMQVLNGTTLAVLASFNYQTTGFVAPDPRICAAMGTYHSHTHTLALGGALASVRIRFSFSTGDSVANTGDGWFVDNLSVNCADAVPPSVPVLTSPPDGTFFPLPPPPSVTLDWADSTDTTSCGPGTVASYVVELDTTNPPIAPFTFTSSPTVSTATTGALPSGTYFWRVRAIDSVGNVSANSTVFSFTIEGPLAPLPPDTLHVGQDTSQSGAPGFVDPVLTEEPAFSAIYRDPNTVDQAVSVRFQVSTDSTFTTLDFDSGIIPLATPINIGERTEDLFTGLNLSRDTVYFWRILMVDSLGLIGPFSAPQSFRIGDDFDFGVRLGSSNHSRRCFVATAAWGGPSGEVRSLMNARSGIVESAAAGRVFSTWYSQAGPCLATQVESWSWSRKAARTSLLPLAAAASCPALSGAFAVAFLALIVFLGIRRT